MAFESLKSIKLLTFNTLHTKWSILGAIYPLTKQPGLFYKKPGLCIDINIRKFRYKLKSLPSKCNTFSLVLKQSNPR